MQMIKHTGIFVHVARIETTSPLHHSAAEPVGIPNPPNKTEHLLLLRVPSLLPRSLIRVGPPHVAMDGREPRRKRLSFDSSQPPRAKGDVSGDGGHRHAW
ncbi:hypothetical protein GW17_00011587 [Ensete ventricosum]|nr:hypothetical protein GW17_00011587 [Ensete ventricosum]